MYDLLESLQSLPYFRYVLPVGALVAAYVVSRVLKMAFWLVAGLSSAPYALMHIDLPLTSDFTLKNPLLILGSGWLLVIAVILVFFIARGALNVLSPGGEKSTLWTAVTLSCLLLVSVLLFYPDFLDNYVPGWKGGAGILLACVALFALVASSMKALKSGLVLIFWCAVCLVIGGEVFLDRLPEDIFSTEFNKIGSLVPEKHKVPVLEIDNLEISDPEVVHVVALGGASMSGVPYDESVAYPARLEEKLATEFPREKFVIDNISSEDFGIHQFEKIFNGSVLPARPDLIIISGWYEDAELDENLFGLSRLTEKEAYERLEQFDFLNSVPFMETALNSNLVRLLRFFSEGKKPENPSRMRTSPDEYRSILEGMIFSAVNAGITVVIFHEQVESGSYRPEGNAYLSAALDFEQLEKVKVIDATTEFSSRDHELLFVKENLLSELGHRVVAEMLFDELAGIG